MSDDFEYAVISDPDVAGFFTGPVDALGNFLSEDIARDAKVARKEEVREIKKLRTVLDRRRRSGNIAKSTYERGLAILDSRQEALERADQPAALTLPAPLDPYKSAMMDTVQPPTRKPCRGNPNGNPRNTPRKDARAAGRQFYLSGRACPAGHTSERRVSSGCCVACGPAWTAANRNAARLHWRESKQRARDRTKLDKTVNKI